ncbi:MAG TPA: GNAT family N-acetyltransferase [Candidatus Binatia bacterium]|jgi:FkbH-like protein|nr:GNAT family N-acetyltransferase [Candidatus Binatia bacterium]
MLQDPRIRIFSLRLVDRLGDNSIVGVAISRRKAEYCEIDTFLLSCRVIGRGVETALLAHVAEQLRRDGAEKLEGWYLPTKKNTPVRDFYAKQGFTRVTEHEGGSLWTFDLAKGQVVAPPWIKSKYVDPSEVLV